MEESRPALLDSQMRAQTLATELYITQEKCFLAMESNKTTVVDLMLLKSYIMEALECTMNELECMQADILKLGAITIDTVYALSFYRSLLSTC